MASENQTSVQRFQIWTKGMKVKNPNYACQVRLGTSYKYIVYKLVLKQWKNISVLWEIIIFA